LVREESLMWYDQNRRYPIVFFVSLRRPQNPYIYSMFVWLMAGGWCWFVLRLVASGWFVLREEYCWLNDKLPTFNWQLQFYNVCSSRILLNISGVITL
jgi:hypothetical protein